MVSIRWIVGAAVVVCALTAPIAFGPTVVRAQGFGVYEQGTCAMGRAGAAVADPCEDGSAIFFNPGALPMRDGATVVSFGGTVLFPGGEFTADDGRETSLDTDVAVVPHGYLVHALNDRAAIGVGVFAPYGLETRWPADFEGRFLGFDNRLTSTYLQVSGAYRVNDRLSIGGGPIVVFSEVELNRRLDLAELPVPDGPPGAVVGDLGIPPNTDFAEAGLETSINGGLGAHVGVALDLGERVRLGARYMSRVEIDYEGDADFSQIETGIPLPANNPFDVPAGTPIDEALAPLFEEGPFADGAVETTITMPAQAVVGVAFEATQQLKLHGDVQWTGWSEFDRVFIDFENPATPDEILVENYDDTITTRAGAELRVDPVILRGGWIWNEAAAPDQTVTPLLPEGERNQLTAGVSYPVAEGWTVDFAYQFLLQSDRRGRVEEPPPGEAPTAALNSGEYSFHSHLVGLTIQRIF